MNLIGPKAIIIAIKKQDPKALGTEAGVVLDKMFDDQFGGAKSELIQKELVPFLWAFMEGLTTELLKDQEDGT